MEGRGRAERGYLSQQSSRAHFFNPPLTLRIMFRVCFIGLGIGVGIGLGIGGSDVIEDSSYSEKV